MKVHLLRTLGLALVALATLVALAAAETLTPFHVARIRSVTAAQISPDGSKVAYVLSVPRRPLVDEDGGPFAELHVASADGTSKPFIVGDVSVGSVQWTPDGRALTFLAKRGKDAARSLYLLPLDGGEARRVVTYDTDITGYTLSPDGRRAAFLAKPATPKDRQDLVKKGFNQEVYEESATPVRVFVTELEGATSARELALDGSASNVVWAPTGNRISVALAPTPLVDDEYMMRRVNVVDVDTGKAVALKNPGKLGATAWSPDARFVAMISGADINDPAEGRLMVAPADGGPLQDMLPNYDGHVAAIAWKDASTIAFIGDEGTGTVVGQVGRDGTGRKVTLPAGETVFTALSLARDGKTAAFVGDSPQHPAEAFLLASPMTTPTRLTNSNAWLADVRLAKQEVVRFKARDGLELEGVLVRPLDERPGTRYPLIMTVHGGPESHDRNGWKTSYSNPGQMAAALGFAVFYPNYRGSTGRGVAFSKLSQGDPAGKEFDDLVDAVDHLVNLGLVDRARVGITGGSYGGYATGWASTYYTDRFAAGVMFVGISDKLSKVGTTDIANEEFYVHAMKRPWENWSFFLERSPIYHAGKSKTPLLILGGTDDPRVHPAQSLELYRYMKLQGKAVRLVRYPGEQHGNRRAAARLDYSLRMLQWMEHYLKGPGGALPPFELDYRMPVSTPTPTPAGQP